MIMRVKDQLVLREIAGQYIIVPIMERVKEVPSLAAYGRQGIHS